MAGREEIVKTLATVYTVCQEKFDTHNYPYVEAVTRWETAEQAHASLRSDQYIMRTSIDVTSTGRVCFHNNITVLDKDGNWHAAYDPRKNDPEWQNYLRLKEKFNE